MNPMHYAEVSTTAPGKHEELDIESGELLYPGFSKGENQLRWCFIHKVYGILSAQLLLTTAISFVTVLYTPINDVLKGSPDLLLFFVFLHFVWMLQNPQYRQQLEDMLRNMTGITEWDNRMMDSLKNFDLSSPEVKEQFDKYKRHQLSWNIFPHPDVIDLFGHA